MFNRYTLALSLCGLACAARAADSVTDYASAKPGDAGYVAEDPQLAQLVGKPAPSITLRSIDGSEIDIVKNYGREPVYLKVWATYCIPCRAQMPGLEKIYEEYGRKMQIVAVDAGIGDDPAKVRAFAAKAKIHMPLAIDDGTLLTWLKLDSTPFHLLIGVDGRIAYAGHQDGPPLDAALKRVLASTPQSERIKASNAELAATLKPGERVPALQLRGPDNSVVEFAPEGRPTAVLFTTAWCESYLKDIEPKTVEACRRAREQADELSQDGSVEWLGIVTNLWTTPKSLASYQATVKSRVPMAIDPDGRAFHTFGIHSLPALVLIDAEGRLARVVHSDDGDLATAVEEWRGRRKN
jgi:thiol-disulfide isomerase/thioredoxin